MFYGFSFVSFSVQDSLARDELLGAYSVHGHRQQNRTETGYLRAVAEGDAEIGHGVSRNDFTAAS